MQHLTYAKRIIIRDRAAKGVPYRVIAAEVGCSVSTVCAELSRCPPGAYNADDAEADTRGKKSRANSRARKLRGKFWYAILTTLARYRSALIAAHIHGVSAEGIYKRYAKNPKENTVTLVFLSAMIGSPLPSKRFFRHGGPGGYRKRRKSRTPFCRNDYVSIRMRASGVAKRLRYGHWEVDLIVSRFGDAILSLVEMKSGSLILARVSSRKADDVAAVIIKVLRRRKVLSITSDRGGEFCSWRKAAEALSCKWYMCDAGNPCQRGLNEQKNGMVRWLIRRNVAWSDVPDAVLRAVEDFLNNRPQPSRNYRTAKEMMPV